MDQAIVQVSDQMSDSLGMLSTLYTVSPLLGIMGTMLGMMNTFYEFGVRGQKSVDILTIGIQEALVTSLWGLGHRHSGLRGSLLAAGAHPRL